MRNRRRIFLATAAVACSLTCAALAGCSAGGATRAGAEETAERFSRAVADRDGSTACGLLVRDAREAVETATRTSCETGVLRLGLAEPRAGAGTERPARVYGRAAIVEDGPDTVFLARSGDTWLVRAAGCSPKADAPFTCALDGS